MRLALIVVVVSLGSLTVSRSSAQSLVDRWRYTLQEPSDQWTGLAFDDTAWSEAAGGFGTRGTPGARVATRWASNEIWLRKTYDLESVPLHPSLLIHHDEDVEIYFNGVKIASQEGFTTEYQLLRLGGEASAALREGLNVMAVHCRQTIGGQFVDVHLVDADNVPKLPAPPPSNKPFVSQLITKWGAEVSADNVWREYPRPQLRRESWRNLNGYWDYAITPAAQVEAPSEWKGKCLVPFCLESTLSGVQRLLDATEALWYRRMFAAAPADGSRTLLNFEAVDYRCQVFVNGTSVGTHQGGHTPFSLDITDAVRRGCNELIVRVEDETESWQLRGKQTLNARGIWYTQVSGIWQTVWLEEVPTIYLEDLKISTDATAGSISVRPEVRGTWDGGLWQVAVKDCGCTVAEAKSSEKAIELTIPKAKRWSPSAPHLYDIEVALLSTDGRRLDQVRSYAGIRSVGKTKSDDGHWRFTLNGSELFHWGPLDQGWWPDGLLTPPSDEAMRFEIEWLKRAGFNMIRKHIKVEPRRYYYHCDRLGMMVWQDHVSGGEQPPWTRLKPNPVDAQWPKQQHQQFMLELERMIATLENHPCIVSWIPFNERWGQHRTMEVGAWVVKRDPTRLINIASGGNFWPVGDVVDAHSYPHPEFPFAQGVGGRFERYVKVMGEFGGHGYAVRGHLWDADRRNWGYGGLPQNRAEYRARYETSLKMLNRLRQQGIAAGVYTQTTDVEGEINGLMTYDRQVIKIPAEELASMHAVLFAN